MDQLDGSFQFDEEFKWQALTLLGLVLLVNARLMIPQFEWLFTGILILATPILIGLEYKSQWKRGVSSILDNNEIFVRTKHNSIVAVAFTIQSVIQSGYLFNTTNMTETDLLVLSWMGGLLIGIVIYPHILLGILSLTSEYTISLNAPETKYIENASDLTNTYYNKDLLGFRGLFSRTQNYRDIEVHDYSMFRLPLNDKEDFSFLSQIPPQLENSDDVPMQLKQNVHTNPVDNCIFCDSSDGGDHILGVVRSKKYLYIYEYRSEMICEYCIRDAIREISSSEEEPNLTRSDVLMDSV